MILDRILLILGCILHSHSVTAIWTCSDDTDCSSMTDSICQSGVCLCPAGKQSVLGGTACVDIAPYHTSACTEDFQCARLFTSFQCRRSGNNTELQVGACHCQPGHHYFKGRCWPSADFGEACVRDEECMGVLRDPYSMSCNVTCDCAEGYYLRQRGECRRSGLAVGDGCVLDVDCQFSNGVCDTSTFTCIDSTNGTTISEEIIPKASEVVNRTVTRQHGAACDATNPCSSPFECSRYGVCVCPLGYYPNVDGMICLAELGSPVSWEGQCVGLFTEIRDGVCTCQANFYFDESMRSCVKANIRLSDFCMSDESCHTFGAATRCGEPQQWGLKSCECVPELAVWDASLNMCRLYAGIGEFCEVDSDCMAGELEIQCVPDDEGHGVCSCPEGYQAVDGLCLRFGLELGEACQVSLECTGTPNTACLDSICSCDNGYQQVEDYCAPTLGGTCELDLDCFINNSVCVNSTSTCQCGAGFVEHEDECWPVANGLGEACNITVQCTASLGEASSCVGGVCACGATYHYRDGGCWPRTGLFEVCTRSSQCYLGDLTDKVHCRNGLCQCTFDFPYSEELRTCRSAARNIVGNSITILLALIYLYLRY